MECRGEADAARSWLAVFLRRTRRGALGALRGSHTGRGVCVRSSGGGSLHSRVDGAGDGADGLVTPLPDASGAGDGTARPLSGRGIVLVLQG